LIIKNVAESFGENKEIEYNALTNSPTSGNCNTSTYTILSKSGVKIDVLKNIEKKIKGNKWGFGEIRPWNKSEQLKAVEQKKKDEELIKQQKKLEGPTKF
jgi:hypothetical protein